MTVGSVDLRPTPVADVEGAVDHHLLEAGESVAQELVAALEAAYDHIGRSPASGSPRYAVEPGLPGLRSWRVPRHPHLVFYMEHRDRIDVWRVPHAQRDIPRWLGPPETDAAVAGDDNS